MGKRSKSLSEQQQQQTTSDQVPEKKSKVTADQELDTTAPSATELSYDEKLSFASPIAHPMAPRKLTKKLLKLIRKSHKTKGCLRSGLRDVQTRIRKGETGICIFAADVTPIDVMCHLPAVCESKGIPYCYVPMRKDISEAMSVRRPTLMALVVKQKSPEAFPDQELYEECSQAIAALPLEA